MPVYDYECPSCAHKFELRQSFDADPYANCPRCKVVSRRQFHPVPVIYKGSGFYTTDYGRSGRNNGNSIKQDKEPTTEARETAGIGAGGS